MRFIFILFILGLFSFGKTTTNHIGTSIVDNSKVMSVDTVVADSLKAIIAQGKALFISNCSTCHDIGLREKLIGPGLHGVTERWGAYPREDLYAWVRNSQALVAKGHPRAVGMFGAWKTIMVSFPNFTDEEIESILVFIENS